MTALRCGTRVPLGQFVNLRFGDHRETALALDISAGGMRLLRLLGPVRLPTDKVGLEFQLEGEQTTIWMVGRVARTRYDNGVWTVLGVEFQGLAPEDSARIRQFVRVRRRVERAHRAKRLRNLTKLDSAHALIRGD